MRRFYILQNPLGARSKHQTASGLQAAAGALRELWQVASPADSEMVALAYSGTAMSSAARALDAANAAASMQRSSRLASSDMTALQNQ